MRFRLYEFGACHYMENGGEGCYYNLAMLAMVFLSFVSSIFSLSVVGFPPPLFFWLRFVYQKRELWVFFFSLRFWYLRLVVSVSTCETMWTIWRGHGRSESQKNNGVGIYKIKG